MKPGRSLWLAALLVATSLGVAVPALAQTVSPSPEAGTGGFGLGTIVAVVAMVILAGVLGGNLFSSRRRPPPPLSVYEAIRRRIDEESHPAGGP